MNKTPGTPTFKLQQTSKQKLRNRPLYTSNNNTNNKMSFNWVLASLVALTAFLFACIASVNLVHISGDEVVMDDFSYNVKPLISPSASGTMLSFMTWLITDSPVSSLILTFLLNKNKVHRIRDIASQLPGLPPLYYPFDRLDKNKWDLHELLSKMDNLSFNDIAQSGFSQKEPQNGIYFGIEDYHTMYKSGEASPIEVFEIIIAATKQMQPKLKMFSSFIEDDVRKQAQDSEDRWKEGRQISVFDGVPVVIKDMIDVKGHVVTDGCKQNFGGPISTKDDTIVDRLRKAGAIILGVTVMTEGGVTPLGYNAHYKGPMNAFSPEHYSGGSSSGSAVAVATGIAAIGISFDGGGSIRIPAAMSGGFGLAVGFGRIPFENQTSSTMIKAGFVASSSRDAALTYMLLSQTEPNHFYTDLYDGGALGLPKPHIHNFFKHEKLDDIRIGIYWDYVEDCEPEVLKKFMETYEFMKDKLGVTFVNITIPYLQEMRLAHGMKITTEFALGFDKYFSTGGNLEYNTKITVALGSQYRALDIMSGERLRSFTFDYVKKQLFEKLHLNAIMTPSIPMKTPKIHEGSFETGINDSALTIEIIKYIFLGNFIGLPGISVPVGYDEDMLPIGCHFMANHWEENILLRISHSLESQYLKRQVPKEHYLDLRKAIEEKKS